MKSAFAAIVLVAWSGGAFAQKYGNRLMQARVFLQAGALALFFLAIVTARK